MSGNKLAAYLRQLCEENQAALRAAYEQSAAYQAAMAEMMAAEGQDRAATMLKSGILPDSATLASAGISQADAAAYVQAVQQAAMRSAKKTAKSSPAASGGGGTQDYSGLFNAVYDSGNPPTSYIANNYKKYGFTSSSGLAKEYEEWARDSGKLDTYIRSVNQIASGGNPEALDGYVKSIWGGLSGREREKLQSILSSYGL